MWESEWGWSRGRDGPRVVRAVGAGKAPDGGGRRGAEEEVTHGLAAGGVGGRNVVEWSIRKVVIEDKAVGYLVALMFVHFPLIALSLWII